MTRLRTLRLTRQSGVFYRRRFVFGSLGHFVFVVGCGRWGDFKQALDVKEGRSS